MISLPGEKSNIQNYQLGFIFCSQPFMKNQVMMNIPIALRCLVIMVARQYLDNLKRERFICVFAK